MTSRRKKGLAVATAGLMCMFTMAQGWGQDAAAPPPPPAEGAAASQDGAPPPPMQARRPPMERAFRGEGPGRHGRWWDNPEVAQKLGLAADQQKQMDDIFQQSRLRLIDQHAAVEKEEARLEPLISADSPDEGQILAQIDRVAQARAELEKANARMLLGVRRVLTPDQWKKLKEMHPHGDGHEGMDREGRHADRGPGSPGPTE
jgi:periplasmic protein CpxP/Spy